MVARRARRLGQGARLAEGVPHRRPEVVGAQGHQVQAPAGAQGVPGLAQEAGLLSPPHVEGEVAGDQVEGQTGEVAQPVAQPHLGAGGHPVPGGVLPRQGHRAGVDVGQHHPPRRPVGRQDDPQRAVPAAEVEHGPLVLR
jgi:hypothetical protein